MKVEGSTRSRLCGLAGLCLALVFSLPVFPKNQADFDTHISLIRGLLRETAVSKVPMPRGKKGIRVDARGKVDKAEADAELTANGTAIKPGSPAEITRITFKSNQIVFELNGGGKRSKKWYQHIELGTGTMTAPISQEPPVLAYGSSVALVYPGKVPQLSVDDVKKALGNVLDFTRRSPTVLYSPEVPPQIRAAIKNHQVIVGMDRDAVLSAKGPPDRRVREVRDGVEQEDWIYGTPPAVLFVTFDGDTVTKVQQY
jgi:hypothetical protein